MAWSEVGVLKDEFYPRFAQIDIPILATALTTGSSYYRNINGWGRVTFSLYGTDDGDTKIGISFFVAMVNRSSTACNMNQGDAFHPTDEMLPAETIPVYERGINVSTSQTSLLFTCDQTCAYVFGNGSATSPVLVAEGDDVGVSISFKGEQESSAITDCGVGVARYFRATQSVTLKEGATIVLCGRMSALSINSVIKFI